MTSGPPTVPFTRLLPAALAVSLGSFLAFKLMAFFVMPVSLLLGIVLACHPLGVLLGARWYRDDRPRAARHLAAVLLVTALGFLVLPRVSSGYFELPRRTGSALGLAVYLASSGAILAPFFTASGAVEYAVLRAAADEPGDRRHRAYASLLLATLAGALLGYASLPVIGVLPIFGAAVALALFAGERRTSALVSAAVAVSIAAIGAAEPALDAAVVRAIAPRTEETTTRALQKGARLLFSGWGKYAYVDVVAHDGPRGGVSGGYNGSMYWSAYGRIQVNDYDDQYALDATVMELLDPGGRLAVIGAGGGKQVQVAMAETSAVSVDAFELEPKVIEVFTRLAPDANDRAYLRPSVRAIAKEGRAGVRSDGRPYDAIYIADAGNFFNYYRSALDFVFFLHTREAYEDYRRALTERGFVAALIMNDLDVGVTQRVVNVLGTIGMRAAVTSTPKFTLIVAAPAERFAPIEAKLAAIAARRGTSAPRALPFDGALENPVPTDDRGSVYVFSLYPARTLRQFFFASLVAIALTVAAILVRARRRVPARGLAPGKGVQLLWLGGNFVLLQNAFITQLALLTLNVSDAVIVGTILFLGAAAVGAAFGERILRRPSIALPIVFAFSAASFVAVRAGLPLRVSLAAELAVFVVSGALFPAVLRSCPREDTPAAFAIDSFGAALATCLLFFVPALYGTRALVLSAFVSTCAIGVWIVLTHARGRPQRA